jgi:hypothetical protein
MFAAAIILACIAAVSLAIAVWSTWIGLDTDSEFIDLMCDKTSQVCWLVGPICLLISLVLTFFWILRAIVEWVVQW